MEYNYSETDGNVPQPSAHVGNLPNNSESFGNMPSDSEAHGTSRNSSEDVRAFPRQSEQVGTIRKQAHTITVREAARMFEAAGVARTERSVVKWCQRDATGIARLDAYFDMNNRSYYITELSIQTAIAEEKAKAFRNVQNRPEIVQKHSDERRGAGEETEPSWAVEKEKLQKDLFELRILEAGKDFVIKQLREERDNWIQQMMDGSKRIGELESRLLQLEDPAERNRRVRSLPQNDSEGFGS